MDCFEWRRQTPCHLLRRNIGGTAHFPEDGRQLRIMTGRHFSDGADMQT
jgi:hypothetical protein